jgi:NAD(P)-dependent dehydrogenase (short-subunit alcohol dehydrogenase family)
VVPNTCARKGAQAVLLLNRPSPRAAAAEAEIKHQVPEGANTVVETIHCDLQDFLSVKNAATQIKSKYDALDVLCNNAGTFTNEDAVDRFSPCCSAPDHFSPCCSALTCPFSPSAFAGIMAIEDVAMKDGYDVQMQTNNLSHFLLTKELYPILLYAKKLHGEARVVHHSSSLRRYPRTPLKAAYLESNGGRLGGNGTGLVYNGVVGSATIKPNLPMQFLPWL